MIVTLILQVQSTFQDGSSMILCNAGTFKPNYKVSHPRRPSSLES